MIRKILILFLGMIFLAGFVLGEEGSAVTYGDVSGNETNVSWPGSGDVIYSSSNYSWVVGIIVLVIFVVLIYWLITTRRRQTTLAEKNKFAQQKYSQEGKKKGVRKR